MSKMTATPKLRSLPLKTEAFSQNVKRSHVQASTWEAALNENPLDLDATKYRWIKDEASKYLSTLSIHPEMFTASPGILKIVSCGCGSREAHSSRKCDGLYCFLFSSKKINATMNGQNML